MDFRPSPAQQLLAATAREFLKAHAGDADLWRQMAALGWPGLLIPPEHGGSGGSVLDVVLLVEEMGRAGAPGPFVASAVVATSLAIQAEPPKNWDTPGFWGWFRIFRGSTPFDTRSLSLRVTQGVEPQNSPATAPFKGVNFPEVTNPLPDKVISCPQNCSGKTALELPGSFDLRATR